jgi:hypothetical protein
MLNFQQVGYGHLDGKPDHMFRLMGRETYHNRYEYYVIHPQNDIKMPIKVKNDWQLNTGDHIVIPGFGKCLVHIYDYDQPAYVPYV